MKYTEFSKFINKIVLITYGSYEGYDKTYELFYVGNINDTYVELFHLINNKYNHYSNHFFGEEIIRSHIFNDIITNELNRITIYEI